MREAETTPPPRVGIILLAAGAAQRFGRDKLREPVCGRPLIEWSIAAATASGLGPLLVVVRPGQASPGAAATAVVNPRAEEGLASSVKLGIRKAEELGWHAAILAPADQPLLSPIVFRRLASAFSEGAEFAVAAYHGHPRNPVLLARPLWPAAHGLTGDIGLAAIARTATAARIECGDVASIRDVDTPEDLAAIEPLLQPT